MKRGDGADVWGASSMHVLSCKAVKSREQRGKGDCLVVDCKAGREVKEVVRVVGDWVSD